MPLPEAVVAALTLGALVVVNALGVRTGSTVQNALMALKIAALLALIGAGLFFAEAAAPATPAPPPAAVPLWLVFGAALTPVMFSYGGWQTASFAAGEMRDARRDLARGVLAGVVGVIVLYVAVTVSGLAALGADGLAATPAPATSVMRNAYAVGERIRIDVEDRCGGLPAEFAATMFSPSTQGSEDRSGVELGLSIVRRSVEATGGTLTVRDLPGTGCVFTIEVARHVRPETDRIAGARAA